MEISPGLHWIDAGPSNLYLGVTEDGLTLVDAGMPKKEKVVLETMHRLGYQPEALRHILVTHADLDHVGSLAAIQAATGARIYAGQATNDYLVQGSSPRHLPWFAQFIVDHFISYKRIASDTVTIIRDGEQLPLLGGVQVLSSPGHTPDHLSFYCPRAGVLFAGDALNTRNGRINASPKRITANLDEARQSAIKLLGLTPAVLACGHGRPLTDHSSKDIMTAFNELRRD